MDNNSRKLQKDSIDDSGDLLEPSKEESEVTVNIQEQKTIREKSKGNMNPTLIIGLGGTGLKAIDKLKGLIQSNEDKIPAGFAFLGFDCDINEVAGCEFLNPDERYAITLVNPKKYYKQNPDFVYFVKQKSFPKDAKYGASQYRQISRMCFMNSLEETILIQLENAITEILPLARQGIKVHLEVYIVSSLCGGAGSGMYTDFTVLLRSFEESLNINATIYGLFVTGDVYQNYESIKSKSYPRLLGNTYSALKELQYLQDNNSQHNRIDGEPLEFKYPTGDIKLSTKPFDLILLVQAQNRFGKPTLISEGQLRAYLANVLFLMSLAPVGKDKQSIWTNPNSGYDLTQNNIDFAPRTFSSVGYFKLMYPESEFVNYLTGYYGEQLLKYFLDNLDDKRTKKKANSSTKITVEDFISEIVEDDVDRENFEFEDLNEKFRKQINDFNFSNEILMSSCKEIVDNENWDKILSKLVEYKTKFQKQIKEQEADLNNAKIETTNKVKSFLKKLPLKLIENNIGIRNIIKYLELLDKDLEEEEAEIRVQNKIIKKEEKTYKENLDYAYNEIFDLIKEKPLFFGRSKLKKLLEPYIISLSNYLNNRLDQEINNFIINSYRDIDEEIAKRISHAGKIIGKLDSVLQAFHDHRSKYQKSIINLASRKKTYQNHMEFSILDLKEFKSLTDECFQKHKITNKKVIEIFNPETGFNFWDFQNADTKFDQIKDLILININPIFKDYRISLNGVINKLKISSSGISEKIEEFKKNCTAQWNVSDAHATCKTQDEKTIGVPDKFPYDRSGNIIKSSSDRMIEILKIEYAMPSQLINLISFWKTNYDKELKVKSDSLHIFPQAKSWSEANEFPDQDENMLYFALGLAFSNTYELTEEENKNLKGKYPKKNYRNFIFQSGAWYILMPFYPLPVHLHEMAADEKITKGDKGFRIQGRQKAYEEFISNHKYYEELHKWIKDRIYGQDVKKTIIKLEMYLDDKLSKEIKGHEDALEKKEMEVLKEYVNSVKKNNYSSLDIDQLIR